MTKSECIYDAYSRKDGDIVIIKYAFVDSSARVFCSFSHSCSRAKESNADYFFPRTERVPESFRKRDPDHI